MRPHAGPDLKTWIARRISVRTRLQQACVHYLLFLMIVTPKHSFTQAARFSGLHKSVFCKLLRDHFHVAVYTLEDLSKTQAKQWAKGLKSFKGLPWKIVILVDSTVQHRARLPPENTKKFTHGKGYVIGHQWTNIIWVIHDILIPLPPLPFHSKAYCRAHALAYQSEHDLVVDYLTNLNLEDYIGQCCPGYERIPEGHFPLLAEGYRLIKDSLRQRQDSCEVKECFQTLPLLVVELVIPENLHITDSRDGWRMRGNELPQMGVCRLAA